MEREKLPAKPLEWMPTTSKALSETYNPKSCMAKMRKVTTINQCLIAPIPTIGTLRRTFGTTKMEALIKLWIVYMQTIIGVKNPMNKVQINYVAQELVVVYGSLNFADVTLVFRAAINGDFGAFYESITPPKVLQWFGDHFNERCNLAAQQSLQSHDSFKETSWEFCKSPRAVMERRPKN